MGADFVLKQMREHQSNYEWFQGKAKVAFIQGKKKTPFTAQIRLKSDSVIWISISSGIGIEGARLILTRDSVKYINRIDKRFFVNNYAYLSALLNTEIDFSMIQALLTAKDFSWYDYQNLKAKLDNQFYQLESTNRHQLKKKSKLPNFDDPVYYQSLWIDPETFKIRRIKMKELGKDNKKIMAEYNQYKEVDTELLPHSINLELDTENPMRLEMEYYKINLNEKLSFPFSINKKYTSLAI